MLFWGVWDGPTDDQTESGRKTDPADDFLFERGAESVTSLNEAKQRRGEPELARHSEDTARGRRERLPWGPCSADCAG